MTTTRTLRGLALAALTGLATTACAGGPATTVEGLEPGYGYVVVDASTAAVGTATVYLYPVNGVRQRLGTVTMDGEQTFRVDDRSHTRFRLLAEHGVQETTSRAFDLTENEVVVWDLDLNRVSYRGEVAAGS